MEMSDLLSLSKRLPFTVSILFHPASLPQLLFNVLLPSNTVNLLEKRLSSHRPHNTNTIGSLSTAGKQAFFFFSFVPLFFFLNKPTRQQTAAAEHRFYPWKHCLPWDAGCRQPRGQPDLAKWTELLCTTSSGPSRHSKIAAGPLWEGDAPGLRGNNSRCLQTLMANF